MDCSCLLHSMYFMCARLKRLLPPNIWFRGLEKLDEMSGLRFFAQPSCLHPRFYASKGKTCRGSPCKEPVNVHLYHWPKKALVSLSPILIKQPLVVMTFGQEVETGAQTVNIGRRQIENQFHYNSWYHYMLMRRRRMPFYKFRGWYVLLGHLGSSISVFRRAELFVGEQSTELPSACQFWPHSSIKDMEKKRERMFLRMGLLLCDRSPVWATNVHWDLDRHYWWLSVNGDCFIGGDIYLARWAKPQISKSI